jgi:hypothetical protein
MTWPERSPSSPPGVCNVHGTAQEVRPFRPQDSPGHDLGAAMPRIDPWGCRGMFFLYFNKLGWPGSIALSIAVTVVLILVFRAFTG